MKSAPFFLFLPLLVLAGCGGDPQPTDSLQGAVRTPKVNVASSQIADIGPMQAGKQLKAKKGGYLLVSFGYTSCPDVCPTTMADIRLAINKLSPSEQKLVTPVFITVDPGRDRPGQLNRYLANFFKDNYQARYTDNPDKLRATEKLFGASHRLGKPNSRGDYVVDHTSIIYAVNDQGDIEVEWPFPANSVVMAEDLNYLFQKQNKNAQPGQTS